MRRGNQIMVVQHTKCSHTIFSILWNGSFLLLLTILALKFPSFSFLGISTLLLVYLIGTVRLKVILFSRLMALFIYILTTLYLVGLSIGAQYAIQDLGKLQRVFTLPPWYILSLFSIYVYPNSQRISRLIQDIFDQIFQSRNRSVTLVVTILLGAQLLQIGTQIITQETWTLSHLQASPEERFAVRRFGVGEAGAFYSVGEFLRKELSTQNQVVLGVPPQGEPWVQSSNPYYVLAFINPSKVMSLPLHFKSVPPQVTHILITKGESETGNRSWPEDSIDSRYIRQIILFDPISRERTVIENSFYDPQLFAGKYGVIELR